MVFSILICIDVWYPYSWDDDKDFSYICSARDSNFNATRCKDVFVTNNTLSITYWSHR